MVSTQNIEFRCSSSRVLLRGRFVFPENVDLTRRIPLVVMLTGDGAKGTKSSSWTNFPPRFAARGIASFLFDFEGLGFSDGERSNLTVTKGIENYRSAFTYASEQAWFDISRIGIFASSFGATVALLAPEVTNKARLLGLKSPATFLPEAYLNECTAEEADRWLETGVSAKLGYNAEVLLDSLRHNAFASAQLIKAPTFITHGNSDTLVPVYQSKLLHACLPGPKQMEIFDEVGHHYAENDAWEKMATMFLDWFGEKL